MSLTAEQVCEIFRVYLGDQGTATGEELGVQASPIRDTGLWFVNAYEDLAAGRFTLAGGAYIVGPDGKLWDFSSNPAIHDIDLAVNALARLYAERLAPHVDPGLFADRLHVVTEKRARFADELIADARSGSLKKQRRVLP